MQTVALTVLAALQGVQMPSGLDEAQQKQWQNDRQLLQQLIDGQQVAYLLASLQCSIVKLAAASNFTLLAQ